MPSVRDRRARRWGLAAVGLLVVAVASAALAGWRMREQDRLEAESAALTGGDPARGRAHMVRFGCAGCHEIPGVAGAAGRVGPPLVGVTQRAYLGGVAANGPGALAAFIADPHAFALRSAMPRTGISRAEARDAAAYLYTQR